jgi:hypothetical protein
MPIPTRFSALTTGLALLSALTTSAQAPACFATQVNKPGAARGPSTASQPC